MATKDATPKDMPVAAQRALLRFIEWFRSGDRPVRTFKVGDVVVRIARDR